MKFMHSIKYDYAPKSFNNIFRLNNDRNVQYELRNTDDFLIPNTRIEHLKKFPLYVFPKTWNTFGDFRFCRNKITFLIALKYFLYNSD